MSISIAAYESMIEKLVDCQSALAAERARAETLKQQAEIWAQEARTQKSTVHEIYQLCTGGKGEPGDWHGADPVRAVIADRDRLRAAIEQAPHDKHCVYFEISPANDCDCWKRAALAQEGEG